MRAMLLCFLVTVLSLPALADPATPWPPAPQPGSIRFATFNIAGSDKTAEAFRARLETGDDTRLHQVAEIIQRVRPDAILLNEFDEDRDGSLAALFQQNYLAKPHSDAQPITFAHACSPPVNTGVSTGVDLNGDGKVTIPHDAHGWGEFPGQYGMLLLSRYPINVLRDFQHTRWIDVPNTKIPTDYYSEQAQAVLRLSSKNHVVAAIDTPSGRVCALISHPTPPVFDGPEDRNGKRNFDEIGLWKPVLDDDNTGPFVILGDLNADPWDGASLPGAMAQLLDHPRVNATIIPASDGAAEAAQKQGGANLTHRTDPHHDTADWSDQPNNSGNLRVDYVLPSIDLTITNAGVFWPTANSSLAPLIQCSDHRAVWVDVER